MVCGAAISIVAAVNYCLLQCTQLCVFRAVTGLPCPGCGLTHAASSLLRGEVVESLLYHALFVPYVVTIGANTITGAAHEDSKNVLKSESNLAISGSGNLTVNAKYKTGIKVDDTQIDGELHEFYGIDLWQRHQPGL